MSRNPNENSLAHPIDVDLDFDPDDPEGQIRVTITNYEPKFAGRNGVFSFEAEVRVNDSRPVNDEKTLYKRRFRIPAAGASHQLSVPRSAIRYFTYDGSKIDLDIHSRVTVERRLMLDKSVREKHKFDYVLKPRLSAKAKGLIEPKDIFSFFDNLRAIPPGSKLMVLGLAVVGGIIILINTIVGAHDQMVPEHMTWVYSHVDTDGEAQSPLVASLTGSGVLGAGVWYAMRRQLRKYMTFAFSTRLPRKIKRGMQIRLADIITGKPRVPLKRCKIRVVGANIECGQYVRGSGTNRRTVSFENPIRAIVVYETELEKVPARSDIASWLPNDSFSFDEMFNALYPDCMVSKSHGLKLRWEVQLLHPQFVDQELVGKPGVFDREDFMTRGHNEPGADDDGAIHSAPEPERGLAE